MDEQDYLDIRTSANEISRLFSQAGTAAALRRLEQLRQDQPLAVQEALDRYVIAENREYFVTADQSPLESDALLRSTRQRLLDSSLPPRLPTYEELEILSAPQQFHAYASIVSSRGSTEAIEDLNAGNRVILGIRNETRTTANAGRGYYDDRMVVLWKNTDNTTGFAHFNANTEPTSQYDARSGFVPRPSPFQDSRFRRAEGMDSNQDGTADLGRLAEGYVEMRATTHLTPGGRGATHFALRPSRAAVEDRTSGVQRDTNGDGWFDSADAMGIQPLNDTFKHHMGSNRNTDSAGCQTLPGQDDRREGVYGRYLEALRGTPGQARWQYVLTSSQPEQIDRHDPSMVTAFSRREADARMPDHPDHRLYSQIRQHVEGMGQRWPEGLDAVSLTILHAAKEANWDSVDAIRTSHPLPDAQAGETVFLVRTEGNDPARQRLAVPASALSQSTVESALDQLAAHAREENQAVPDRLQQSLNQTQPLAR